MIMLGSGFVGWHFGLFQGVIDQVIINKRGGIAHAQTSSSQIDGIKSKITTIVSSANGKITLATKNRLIELISNRIKASSNESVTDIYIHFLREVKKLRTIDEIVPISSLGDVSSSVSPSPTTPTPHSGPDFSISFASLGGQITIGQKFAPLSLKIKNNGSEYTPQTLNGLKIGCKGVDGGIYPYWSYSDNQSIPTGGEIIIDIQNVVVGHLTTSKGLKLLTCKVDSADMITEINEDNNIVNVSIQLY
ncbi:MAG TPA: hypothetical protein PK048_02175 [Candidatus Absconditabacterales bacterium]|nr:hypothetical protein [Candidatus Absconditabacterales bacterium]